MPQPVADARYSAFVRVGARVWTVEDAPVAEQPHADAGAMPLADFGAQLDEQHLDVWPPEATSKRKPQGLGLTRDDRTEIGPGVWRTAKGRISGFCEAMPAASRGNPGRGDRLLFSRMEKVRIEARLPAALADQARAFVAEGCATDLDELLAEALRRFLESHAPELTYAYMKEDVQWGLRGND